MIGVWGAIDFDWPSRRPRRRPPPPRSRRRTRRQVGTRRRRRRTNATCRLSLFCLFRDDDDARVERCNFPINLQVGRGGRSARERLEPLDAFASRLNRPLSIGLPPPRFVGGLGPNQGYHQPRTSRCMEDVGLIL